MDFLKRLLGLNTAPTPPPQPFQPAPPPSPVMAGLPQVGGPLPASLKAHSQFIKRVNCPRCGAPKTLPSATAYLYCDYCGSLMDYDFRIANLNTNAGVTNTVFSRLMAPHQNALAMAKSRGDREAYRQLYTRVYAQWVQECPMAVSPRVKGDTAFREQFIKYQVECAVAKDFDPRQAPVDAQIAAALAALQRLPQSGGAWRVAGPFWQYAQLYKQQMESVYALLQQTGVLALDPDQAPPGVPLRMEYSTFCQGWLPHLAPEEGARLLEFYGLQAEYDQVKPQATDQHRCGGCGAQITTVHGARQVVCESCGRSLDISAGDVPCRKCGAALSFPVSVNQVQCPYCQTPNQRV
jgi:DNA-directed RNA polymerase subunit RPC12/RpoP